MSVEPFEEEVAEGVRAGDPDALAAAWRALAPGLVGYLHAQVGDRHTAEDLAQETFLELVRSCRRITGGPRQIRAWLYKAALRNVLDWRKARGRRPEDSVPVAPEVRDPADLAEGVATRDHAARVRGAMQLLSPEQSDVITLRFLADLSAPEVARLLGRSEGAVRALQHRGLASLGRLLEDPEPVPFVGAASPGGV